MSIHITPLPGGTDNTERAAETPARLRRFTDQRGIALQTVIIMVVMLAIAGGVAAVLLSRGGEASSQLENQNVTVSAHAYASEALCKAAGHTWDTRTLTGSTTPKIADIEAARSGYTYTAGDGFCA